MFCLVQPVVWVLSHGYNNEINFRNSLFYVGIPMGFFFLWQPKAFISISHDTDHLYQGAASLTDCRKSRKNDATNHHL